MKEAAASVDIAHFIQTRLHLGPVPGLPTVRLYTAHSGSGLARMASGAPPYWAYLWAGGLALAHHLAAHPGWVRDRRVLDLGAGSGLVAIAAAKAGASLVHAAETDRAGNVAIDVNAAANDVFIDVIALDLLDGPPPDVDIVLVGDLFYAAALARRVSAFLARCHAAGLDVLVGDPGRAPLPTHLLQPIATYDVADFGAARDSRSVRGTVFTFENRAAGGPIGEMPHARHCDRNDAIQQSRRSTTTSGPPIKLR